MFISNIRQYESRHIYRCGNVIGKYLEKKGIPVLGRTKKEFIFSKTNELQKAIDKMPFHLRFLVKAGVING